MSAQTHIRFGHSVPGPEFQPLFSPLTFPALLERSFSGPAEQPALGFVQERPMSYGELRDCVSRLAGLLRANGLHKGDKVALLGENHPHWAAAFFAVTSIGAAAVPVMHEFPRPDIRRILALSGSRAAFVSDKYRSVVEQGELPPPGLVVRLEDLEVVGKTPGRPERDGAKPAEAVTEAVGEDDPASLVFTSGTSGFSKGVLLTQRNLVHNAMAIDQMCGRVVESDRLLSILPLAHATECTLGLIIPVMKRASVAYMDKPPSASALLPALAAVRPTIMIAVPLVMEKLFKTRIQPELKRKALARRLTRFGPTRRLLHRLLGRTLAKSFGGCLRMFCMGGASLSAETAAFLDEAGFPYTVGYGLTEAAPLVTGDPPSTFVSGSCGRPLPGVEVRLAGFDPAVGEGEIEVRGPNVMAGYYPSAGNVPAFTPDGWLKTGDIGAFDSRGSLYFRGRLKNVIVHSSGKKTYPEAIESLLNVQPYVGESLVREVDGAVTAFVALDPDQLESLRPRIVPGGTVREAAVAALLRSIMTDVNRRLPSWSRIRRIVEQKTPFEKTPSKKIRRGSGSSI
ncbi:MAG: AMP-binding protein [Candidatus Aminicenantes bacterium]|nr:AMP-binding protein [Candidatus Aminicenantes bacterium]